MLEAVYALSLGVSFRGTDRELIAHGEDWFRLEGWCDEQHRLFTYRLQNEVAEKQFTLDGAKKMRLSHKQKIPVVLFEPEHLRLLRGSPSQRRDYLDTLLSRLWPDFSWTKHQFERVLTQRNNVLKRRLLPSQRADQLFVWDVQFADLAQQLVERRRALLTRIGRDISAVYSAIAQRPSDVVPAYECTVPGGNYRDTLLRLLDERSSIDAERGFTTIGPQRDDFTFTLGGVPAATSASRGEVRSLVLALKIIELRLFDEQADSAPILLLDDVFSELDSTRRRALAELARTHQTLITTTDADAITSHFAGDHHIITTD